MKYQYIKMRYKYIKSKYIFISNYKENVNITMSTSHILKNQMKKIQVSAQVLQKAI